MATEPATEHMLETGRRPRSRRATASTSTGSVRGASPCGGCGATRPRWRSGSLFLRSWSCCLAAPLWANARGRAPPVREPPDRQIVVDGKPTDVVSLDGTPIGPTWQGQFFLGADTNGRDTAVRLLYGGRNSLLIGLAAAFITTSWRCRGAGRRVLPRVDRQRHLRCARRDLGLPGGPVGCRARHGAQARGSSSGR